MADELEGNDVCRYCLGDDQDEPLVVPCACRGSARHVHISCLVAHARAQHSVGVDISTNCPTCLTPFLGSAGLQLLDLELEHVRDKYGEEHIHVVKVLNLIAGQLIAQLHIEEASARAQQAVDILTRLDAIQAPFSVAGEPLDLLEALSMLFVLQDMSKNEDSKYTEARLFGILKEHYSGECGIDAVRVAKVLLILSQGCTRKTNQHNLLTRSWKMLEGFYGKDKVIETLNAQDALVLPARVFSLKEIGEFEAAEEMCARICPKVQQTFGMGHMMSAILVVTHAAVMCELCKLDEAQDLLSGVICAADAGNDISGPMVTLVRVERARLFGVCGRLGHMREECQDVVDQLRAGPAYEHSCVNDTALRCLRVAEAAFGNKEQVLNLFAEARELPESLSIEVWEDLFTDAQAYFAIESSEEAAAQLQQALQKLSDTWGSERMVVLRHAVTAAKRFWLQHLSGSRRDAMDAWLEGLLEEATLPEIGAESLQSDLDGASDHVPLAKGDAVRSFINLKSSRSWALQEGDEGTITQDPQHGCAIVSFGEGHPYLRMSLADVCRKEDFDCCMAGRRKPCRGFEYGQRVRSLDSTSDWHPRALNVGDSGIITALDRAHGRVNVDFGGPERLQCTLLLESVCALDVFDARAADVRRAMGGYLAGDHVRALVAAPHWRPRPLDTGERGVILVAELETQSAIVQFGGGEGVRGRLPFQSICLEAEWESRAEEALRHAEEAAERRREEEEGQATARRSAEHDEVDSQPTDHQIE